MVAQLGVFYLTGYCVKVRYIGLIVCVKFTETKRELDVCLLAVNLCYCEHCSL